MTSRIVLALAVAALFGSSDLYGQSQARKSGMKKQRQLSLGKVVSESQRVSMDNVDHSDWNRMLGKYVDDCGGVSYSAWHASPSDSQALDRYIDKLAMASLTVPANRSNQMAYWINAYNAVTIKGILQEFPTSSIRNHTSETGGYNIWKNLMLNVGGRQISLDAIEHQVLRPMGDARIHFAIVCASVSCPRLLNQAYVGKSLNEQLDKNAKHFFSIPQNFQHDPNARRFKLSAILQWFGKDFGPDQASQLRAISKYLPTQTAQAAANSNAVSVSFLDYSWDLNDSKMMAKTLGSSKKAAGAKSGSQRR